MADGQKLAGKKILLVEDDAFLSDVIAQKLSSSKCIFSHVLCCNVEGLQSCKGTYIFIY